MGEPAHLQPAPKRWPSRLPAAAASLRVGQLRLGQLQQPVGYHGLLETTGLSRPDVLIGSSIASSAKGCGTSPAGRRARPSCERLTGDATQHSAHDGAIVTVVS